MPGQPQSLPLPRRIAHAVPDAVTAGIFLYAWWAPFAWRKTLVAELMLVMLIEFILVHAAPFLGSIALAPNLSTRERVKTFALFTFFYSLFVITYSTTFRSWWPALGFVWLVTAKLFPMLTGTRQPDREQQRMMGYWGVSVACYMLAITATLFLPVPEFGINRHGSAYGIPGSGEWVSRPHILIAAGFLYFGLLSLTRLVEQPTWWRNLKVRPVQSKGYLFRSQ